MFVGRTEKRKLLGRSLRSEDLHLRVREGWTWTAETILAASLLSRRSTWVHTRQTSTGNATGPEDKGKWFSIWVLSGVSRISLSAVFCLYFLFFKASGKLHLQVASPTSWGKNNSENILSIFTEFIDISLTLPIVSSLKYKPEINLDRLYL